MIHTKKFSNALIVGVLGVAIHVSSVTAQDVIIATAEPLPVVAGQTQVHFTTYYFDYARTFSCASMNYVQRVVIENPGIPGGTKSVEVLSEVLGPVRPLFIVDNTFSCDGYQFLDLFPTESR
jgi:hypothetical protein